MRDDLVARVEHPNERRRVEVGDAEVAHPPPRPQHRKVIERRHPIALRVIPPVELHEIQRVDAQSIA